MKVKKNKKKKNYSKSNLGLLFLSFIVFIFPSSSVLYPCGLMPPIVPTFARRLFLQSLLSVPSSPPFYLPLSLMLSFDSQRSTFNGSHLLIKYLQGVCSGLAGIERQKEMETKEETERKHISYCLGTF